MNTWGDSTRTTTESSSAPGVFTERSFHSRTHLQILARIARMMQLPNFLDDLRAAETEDEAYRIICEAEEKAGK